MNEWTNAEDGQGQRENIMPLLILSCGEGTINTKTKARFSCIIPPQTWKQNGSILKELNNFK